MVRELGSPLQPLAASKGATIKEDGKTIRKRGTVTPELIMEVASAMFQKRGYDRTSLEDIATALHITKPSLYYHFSGKEEILLACIESGHRLFNIWLEERDQVDLTGKERLRIFVTAYVELLKDQVLSVLVSDERVMSEAAKKRYRHHKRALHNAMVERLEAGRLDGSLQFADSRYVAFSIFGMVNWMTHWPDRDLDLPIEQIATQFCDIAFDGISAG